MTPTKYRNLREYEKAFQDLGYKIQLNLSTGFIEVNGYDLNKNLKTKIVSQLMAMGFEKPLAIKEAIQDIAFQNAYEPVMPPAPQMATVKAELLPPHSLFEIQTGFFSSTRSKKYFTHINWSILVRHCPYCGGWHKHRFDPTKERSGAIKKPRCAGVAGRSYIIEIQREK